MAVSCGRFYERHIDIAEVLLRQSLRDLVIPGRRAASNPE